MRKHAEANLEDTISEHLTTQDGHVFVGYREGTAKNR